MIISSDPWMWVSAFLTLCSFTLLYGDNPLFRIGEHTFTATVIGHSVVTGIDTLRGQLLPLYTGTKMILLVPLVLGLTSLFIVWRKYAWIASFAFAVMIGVGTGISMRALMMTDLIGSMRSIISETAYIFVGPPENQLGYLIRVVFSIIGTLYLLFTIFVRGPLGEAFGYIRTFGKYVFLIFFGLAVGNSLMMLSGLATSAIGRVIKGLLGL